jgi:hypothetical protein
VEGEVMAAFFVFVGVCGSTLLWIFGIRPLVVRHGKGYKTGVNLAVAAWVDWQSCREIAKNEDDGTAMLLVRAFLICQASIILGICIALASA